MMKSYNTTLYYISEFGYPRTHCVDSLLKIPRLVQEIYPDATDISVEVGILDDYITVTFYNVEQDMDVTYDVEMLEI